MKKVLIAAAAAAGALLCANASLAQQTPPPAQPTPPPPLAVTNPSYIAIVQEIDVAKPATAVWQRIGKYCDLTEWLGPSCVITSGQEGQLGSVRLLNGTTVEVMVGKTDLSYTYTQPVRVGVAYNQYHGTLEVKPITATTSKIVYSLFFDNSMLADDAARERDRANRATRFMAALTKMKMLAEGGKIAPPANPPTSASAPR